MFMQHIAAAQGNENCVLLLLDFGADANSRGSFVLEKPYLRYNSIQVRYSTIALHFLHNSFLCEVLTILDTSIKRFDFESLLLV